MENIKFANEKKPAIHYNFNYIDRNEFLEEIEEEEFLNKWNERIELHFIYHVYEKRINKFIQKHYRDFDKMKEGEFFAIGLTQSNEYILPAIVRKEGNKIHIYSYSIFDSFYYQNQKLHYSEKDRELVEKIERFNKRKKIIDEIERRKNDRKYR